MPLFEDIEFIDPKFVVLRAEQLTFSKRAVKGVKSKIKELSKNGELSFNAMNNNPFDHALLVDAINMISSIVANWSWRSCYWTSYGKYARIRKYSHILVTHGSIKNELCVSYTNIIANLLFSADDRWKHIIEETFRGLKVG